MVKTFEPTMQVQRYRVAMLAAKILKLELWEV